MKRARAAMRTRRCTIYGSSTGVTKHPQWNRGTVNRIKLLRVDWRDMRLCDESFQPYFQRCC